MTRLRHPQRTLSAELVTVQPTYKKQLRGSSRNLVKLQSQHCLPIINLSLLSVVIAQDNNSRYSFFPNISEIFCLCFFVITSVRVPPLSLRGYEGWATCGQNTLTGSPLASLTIHFFISCSTFVFRLEIFVPPFLLGIFCLGSSMFLNFFSPKNWQFFNCSK